MLDYFILVGNILIVLAALHTVLRCCAKIVIKIRSKSKPVEVASEWSRSIPVIGLYLDNAPSQFYEGFLVSPGLHKCLSGLRRAYESRVYSGSYHDPRGAHREYERLEVRLLAELATSTCNVQVLPPEHGEQYL